MSKYDFDIIHDRHGTSSLKYDFAMVRKGRDDLLPLWVADMDFRLPDEILDDITARTGHGIFGYTDPDKKYYKAVQSWYSRRQGFEIEDDWITLAPGIVYSIACAVRAFTKPGETVLIQQPVYYPFMEVIQLNRRELVNNQLICRNGHYEIDFDDFERKIIENDVRLFILCSPHNPVGRVWSKEELLTMAEICAAHGVFIYSDEIHSDFVYPGHRHTSFITLGDKYTQKLILGTSPSKSFNIAGLQIANIIIPDRETRSKYRLENAAAGYSQGNTLGIFAAASAYTRGEEWFEELLIYLKGNLDYVRSFIRDNIPEVRLIEPEGTYLIWLEFSALTEDPADLERLIVEEALLWTDSGIIFGRETALFERINIACPRSVLEQALHQLYNAIRKRRVGL